MEVQRFDGRLERGEQADGQTHAPGALQDINAAAHAVNGAGKVEGMAFEKTRPLLVADKSVGRLGQRPGGQGFAKRAQSAAYAQSRRQPRFEVQIARAIIQRHANQRLQIHSQCYCLTRGLAKSYAKGGGWKMEASIFHLLSSVS